MPRPRKKTLLCQCDNCVLTVNSDGTHGVYRPKKEHKAHLRTLKAERQSRRIIRNAEPEIIYEPTDSDSDEEEPGFTTDVAMANEFSQSTPLDRPERQLEFHTEKYFEMPDVDDTGVSQTVMFISLFASLFFSLSRDSSDLLLRLLKCLVDIMLKHTVWADWKNQIFAGIPKSFKTVRSRYHLEDSTRIYAVCPVCHCTYEGRYDNDIGDVVYPKVCAKSISPDGPICNTALLRADGTTPVKKFVYNSVIAFIGSLVSRSSIEQSIDEACDNLRSSSFPEPRGPFQAEFLRNLKGPEPGKLFIDRGNELRLAFSLNVDFFNVQGVRSGAASVSCGIISLICLNLPEGVRHKDENTYLAGIIPGPKEPSLTEINHYLAPLVKEFNELWNSGVHLTRTPSSPQGRLCRAVIALVVCDLPAARKVAGLLGHGSTEFICSHCKCHKDMIGDVNAVFESRDGQSLRQKAEEWRDARTISQRKQITSTHGVRWSELWRLPYWDPTKQLVVDPMHCLLLGLVSNHFSSIFPLREDSVGSSKTAPYNHDFTQIPTVDGVRANRIYIAGKQYEVTAAVARDVLDIHKVLLQPVDPNSVETEQSNLSDKLERKNRVSLMFVADSLGLRDAFEHGTARSVKKLRFANALAEWRFTKPLQASIRLTTPALFHRMQHVIETASTPTFVRSVPKNFGTSSAGKIKADEWRTLCTIFFPIALMSHYLGGEITDVAFKERYKAVLDHTMELVQAVCILFRQSTSESAARKYEDHIKMYISGLQVVHPTSSYTPNMHMSLHIAELLPQFGSVYSWWTFPFERLIGKLQDMPSNNKLGQFEGTMLNSFIALSRMKQLISQDSSHDGIQACLQTIKEILDKDGSSVPPEDTDNPDDLDDPAPLDEIHPVSSDAQEMLNRHPGRLVRRLKWNNAQYCVAGEHAGNSQIGFRWNDTVLPGIIIHILKGANPIFIVHPFIEAYQDAGADPFSEYSDCFMTLRTFDPQSALGVISCDAVVGHFAAYNIYGASYVLRPLF